MARCPAAPIKRPPSNRDELLEETDYYTDDFLSQTTADGVNGLWITVRFRETADTPYYPRDPLAEKRLEKLRTIVAKCARYGIKVWLFAVVSVGENETRTEDNVAQAGTWGVVKAEVGAGSVLTIPGSVGKGGFVKTGAGRVVLSGANDLARGATVEVGTLAITDVSAVASSSASPQCGVRLAGGAFEYFGGGSGESAVLPGTLFVETPGFNDLADVKIDSPLTVTNVSVASGAILKRGAGALTFAPPPGATMTLTCTNGTATNETDEKGDNVSLGDISDDGWTPPTSETGANCGFNVAEGEVALVGDATATVQMTNIVKVGLRATGGRAQPKFTVDGLKATFGSASFVFASRQGTTCDSMRDTFLRNPEVEFRNGADVMMRYFKGGEQNYVAFGPTVTVDNATWTVFGQMTMYGYNNDSATTPSWSYRFVNGATVYTAEVNASARCRADAGASVDFSGNDLGPGVAFSGGGTFANAAADVSDWRAANAGDGATATLSLDGLSVVATIRPTGFMIIVR